MRIQRFLRSFFRRCPGGDDLVTVWVEFNIGGRRTASGKAAKAETATVSWIADLKELRTKRMDVSSRHGGFGISIRVSLVGNHR
jgi:hypothetical protein